MAYQNILVPIDGSETSLLAIKHAVKFAKAFESRITVVQVMTLDPYVASEYLASGHSNPIIERARELICNNLALVKDLFIAEGVHVETKLLEGENIPHTLNQAVQDLRIDLIILSSHGRTGLKKIIMGSVAQNLLTELQIPVLVVK